MKRLLTLFVAALLLSTGAGWAQVVTPLDFPQMTPQLSKEELQTINLSFVAGSTFGAGWDLTDSVAVGPVDTYNGFLEPGVIRGLYHKSLGLLYFVLENHLGFVMSGAGSFSVGAGFETLNLVAITRQNQTWGEVLVFLYDKETGNVLRRKFVWQ